MTKHWSNIIFVIAIILVLHPSSKEWLIKTIAFSPSFESEQKIVENFNWKLKGLNTEDISLNELKGKVVFVNFWATCCPPCRAELPAIQSLYSLYKDKVAFVFVTQETKEVVNNFFNTHNYNLPVYNSVSNVPSELATTNSIPATYVLNKKGVIVISKTGAASWDSDKTKEMIETLLKE